MAQFAQIPLLNDKQLVARWRQEMPPTYVSDSQDLPVDPLPAGLYLVEATDGHYKAYTLMVVSDMALVTRTTERSCWLSSLIGIRAADCWGGGKAGFGTQGWRAHRRRVMGLPRCMRRAKQAATTSG